MRELTKWMNRESIKSEPESDSDSDYENRRFDKNTVNLLHKAYVIANKLSIYGM